MGGGLLGTYYVYKNTPNKNFDAFSEENTIVFAPSIMTGALIAGVSRFNISAKSPLTGAIGDTQCGGSWGPTLKFSGYDGSYSRRPIYHCGFYGVQASWHC